MTKSVFIFPEITSHKTKVQQITELRAVRNIENENYALLLYRNQKMLDVFKLINHRWTSFAKFGDNLLVEADIFPF